MRGEEGGVVAEDRRHGGAAAGGRQVAHADARRLQEHLDRQMRHPVQPAGRVDDLAGPLLGVVDELLEAFPGLLGVDEEQDRVGRDAGDRLEFVAGEVGRPAEHLVDHRQHVICVVVAAMV